METTNSCYRQDLRRNLLVGMIFAFALPASFTRGLMTGILGEEYNIGNMDELDDLMDDFGVYYNFS